MEIIGIEEEEIGEVEIIIIGQIFEGQVKKIDRQILNL